MSYVNSKLVQCVGRPRQAGWDCPGTFNGLGLIEKDPFWANVILLMKFDGGITDQSPLGQAFTAYGSAGVTSTNAKFTQSLSPGGTFPTGGGTSRLQSNAARAEYDLGTSDFTIECWARDDGTGVGNTRAFISVHSLDQPRYLIGVQNPGGGARIAFGYREAPSTYNQVYADLPVLTAGTWNHIAACRVGGGGKLYVNGVQQAGAALIGVSANGNLSVSIGSQGDTISSSLSGLIDEVRITKGVARYTSSFTPPTGPFPTS